MLLASLWIDLVKTWFGTYSFHSFVYFGFYAGNPQLHNSSQSECCFIFSLYSFHHTHFFPCLIHPFLLLICYICILSVSIRPFREEIERIQQVDTSPNRFYFFQNYSRFKFESPYFVSSWKLHSDKEALHWYSGFANALVIFGETSISLEAFVPLSLETAHKAITHKTNLIHEKHQGMLFSIHE